MTAVETIRNIVRNALTQSKLGTLKVNSKSFILTMGSDRFVVRVRQKVSRSKTKKVAPVNKPVAKPVAAVAVKKPALKVLSGAGKATTKPKPTLKTVDGGKKA